MGVTAVDKKIDLDGEVFAYREAGDPAAAPVVLLHAATRDATSWDGVIPALADRYRVLALHQRGHGPSPHRPPYGFVSLRRDLTRFADRLERAGFLWREKDPADRRRVFIRLAPERLRRAGEVFASSQRAWMELCERYTDEQLALIIDFMTRSTAILQEETAKLRRRTKPHTGRNNGRRCPG